MIKENFKTLAMATLLGVSALVAGCGGGGAKTPSCEDTNTCAPSYPPLIVNPSTVNVYANTPAALTISSGVAPFQIFSQDSTVLPVTQAISGASITLVANNVETQQNVTLTIRDAVGQITNAAVTVLPSPLLGTLSVTPLTGSRCGATSSGGEGEGEGEAGGGTTGPTLSGSPVCSGETATVAMTLRGANALPIANRQVRFDVLQGPYNFVLDQAATQFAKQAIIVTDQNGQAIVAIKADGSVSTQVALLRATDVISGNRVDTSFTIVQAGASGAATLSVQPATWTIAGYYDDQCGAGSANYIVYGGTAPYTITNLAPGSFSLSVGTTTASVVTVPNTGGVFRATALGGLCGGNISGLFSIVDATGRVITAQMISAKGTVARPTVPDPTKLAVNPPSRTGVCLANAEFPFTIVGGVAPYTLALNIVPAAATIVGTGVNRAVRIGPSALPPTTLTVTIIDSGSESVTTTITCE